MFKKYKENGHKVYKIFGIKLKFKIKSAEFCYDIQGENNKIIIVDENGIEKVCKKFYMPELNININGNNNTIKLHEPIKIKCANFDIQSNNAYIEIKSPRWGINSLYLTCNSGNNQRFIVGKGCFISSASVFLAEENASCIIEDGCMLSMNIVIMPTDCHPIYDTITQQRINNLSNEVRIGKHCWIGMGATLTKNVRISDNSIIGINSTVTKSFNENYCAIAGNPAKIVKRNVTWSWSFDDVAPRKLTLEPAQNGSLEKNK